ncbi:MAG: hypothetical protein BroJett014_11100 [Planctomycetota bacterium]|nr:MAG: hypothetical protein BroJett014_11100 [Planctomycetota bacterium]
MAEVEELDKALRNGAIPIVGVVLRRRGPPVEAYVQYAPEATAAQKKRGEAILEAFDWETEPKANRMPTTARPTANQTSRTTKRAPKTQTKKTRSKNHE